MPDRLAHPPRPATHRDIPAMHRVRLAVRQNRLANPARITTSDYALAMAELGRTWLIEVEGEVVAFGSGYRDGSIWALFVHPEHEGRGHGQALHAIVVEWLWSLGHERLWLTTEPGTRAERFYFAQGWQFRSAEANGEVRLELARSAKAAQ